ncbi:MAG: ABC transporter ATP-binding protein [Lachnospiraceae bacterium]|nr:ABC transporter ATP-binding protein [Lachnospiraceae bacterium]
MVKVDIREKRFGEKEVFEDLVFTLPKAGIYAVTGASGRGKTTLLNMIAGIDKDYKGSVAAEGSISYVFQEDRLLPWLNALENVTFVCRDSKKAADMLKRLGLEKEITSRISELSGGMKRRVAIARALAADYDILLLDEPFSSVDEGMKQRIMDTVKELTAGKLVILVTHDAREAEYLGAEKIEL